MKYLLSFTLAIISITQFFGQEDFIQKGITIEPFVGYSQSTFIDGDIPESAYLRTYTVGVIGNYFANKTWSIRTGIIKDRMGGSLFGLKYNTPNGTFFLSSAVLEQEFISIPLQANWHFSKRKRWNLAFGINYALSIGDKLEFGDQVYSNFIAGALDIGYKFPIGPGNMVIRTSAIVRSENETSIYSTQRRSSLSIGYALKL